MKIRRSFFAISAIFTAIVPAIASGQTGRIVNLSSRAMVPPAGVSLTFTISGSAPKIVLLRAVGPSLANFGISNALANPQLSVANAAGATVASNDDWGGDSAITAAAARVGAFTLNATSLDSALLLTLAPGAYTAIASGVTGTTGVALIEIYDADSSTTTASTFSSLSFRGPAGGSSGPTLTVGATVRGGPLPVMVRALGPALTSAGVAGAIADPSLALYGNDGAAIASNNDWGNDPVLASLATQAGVLPLATNSKDSALLVTASAGAVTTQVTSANNASGTTQVDYVAAGSLTVAPLFTAQPPTQTTATIGGSVSLGVAAAGLPAPALQWKKNGVAIVGATTATFTIASAQAADTGTYTCTATNSAGSATTPAAQVTVGTAPVFATPPTSGPVIAPGGSKLTLTATASGEPAPAYQWLKNNTPIAGATSSTFTLASVQPSDAGSYTCLVTNALGTTTSPPAQVVVGPSAWLSNLSVRTTLDDAQLLTVGAVVVGGSRNVLLRAAGPALKPLGIAGFLPDPKLVVYDARGVKINENDDWNASLGLTFASVGAFGFPSGSHDAALVQPLDGAVTLQASGTGSGVVLIEAYDLGNVSVPRMTNLSVRGRVGAGQDVLIAGFTISGTGSKDLLVRGIGPALAAFGVNGTLADPRVEIFDGNGTLVAANDNWPATLAATMAQVGAFTLANGSNDAAASVTLPPGSYSAVVKGSDGGTGEALVEIYDVR